MVAILVRTDRRLSMSCGTLSWSRRASVSRILSPDVSQKLFTFVGLPCWIVSQPSRARRCNTSRNVVRVTPISSESSPRRETVIPDTFNDVFFRETRRALRLYNHSEISIIQLSKDHSSYQTTSGADSRRNEEKGDRRSNLKDSPDVRFTPHFIHDYSLFTESHLPHLS